MARKLFAVVGKPIMHSASPKIHNAAFKALGLDAKYTRMTADNINEAIALAKNAGISGLNVTAPFKEEAYASADKHDISAKKTGAVNTIIFGTDGKTYGYNTDVDGVTGALAEAGVKIEGVEALVVGAGGAARAAVFALIRGGAKVTIANRTAANSKKLAKKFGCRHCSLAKKELAKVMPRIRIIVGAVSTKERIIPPKLHSEGMVVLDANYSAETALIKDAEKAGCRVISGKEWLLCQAYAAFELFTEKKAPKKIMKRALLLQDRAEKKNIALVGFTGSGKSTVGKLIGKMTGMPFFDTDEMAVREEGMAISDIFKEKGEKYFRNIETKMVRKACGSQGAIISVAGGALLNPKNAAQVAKTCKIVWLFAGLEELLERLEGDRSHPLLEGEKEEKKDKVLNLMKARYPTYAACADLIVGTEGKKPVEVAEKIIEEMRLPTRISGTIIAPPSKSLMVRAAAVAMLTRGKTTIINPSYCDDALAAMSCVRAFGAKVKTHAKHVEIVGGNLIAPKRLDCGESALCLRLFAPIAALFGGKTILDAKGTLKKRDIGMMVEPLVKLGIKARCAGGKPPLMIEGKLHGGEIEIDASKTSQFLSGLLMALPLCKEDSRIFVKKLKSKPYIRMTLKMLHDFGIEIAYDKGLCNFAIRGKQEYNCRQYVIEGDWSGASFLLVAGAIAGKTEIRGLQSNSLQADREILNALRLAGAKVKVEKNCIVVEKNHLHGFEFDCNDSPDLIPPLAALACHCKGTTRIFGAIRLKGKESDRAKTLLQELKKMGAKISVKENEMRIRESKLHAAKVDSHADHRVAMACAIAALGTEGNARIKGADCVAKSYPDFFVDLALVRVKK